MTRLAKTDIDGIIPRLPDYNEELLKKLGGGLADIAAKAAGGTASALQKGIRQKKIGIVPITSGLGIIEGFSETIREIMAFLGADVFVTKESDVAGIGEAMKRGAGRLFLADDQTCSLMDLETGTIADNSVCTGRGFAAALSMKAKDLTNRRVAVLGAGPVGRGAIRALLSCGADIVVYDTNPRCLAPFHEAAGVTVAHSASEALQSCNIYFEATTSGNTIDSCDMDGDTLVAAPGVPLGVSREAVLLHEENIIHDTLEIGVASMLFSLVAMTS